VKRWRSIIRRAWSFCRRDAETASEQAAAVILLVNGAGIRQLRAMGTFVQGWAQVARGHKHEGLEQIYEGSRAIAATGNDAGRPLVLGVLAEVHSQAGQFDAGWSCVTEALAAVESATRSRAELHSAVVASPALLTAAKASVHTGPTPRQTDPPGYAPRPNTPNTKGRPASFPVAGYGP